MSYNSQRKDIIKKKINLLLELTEIPTILNLSPQDKRVNTYEPACDIITEDLVAFVFETTQNETHYLYMKPVEKYDEYDVSNFVSYLRRHCKLARELNNGVI